jgi:cytoskeleton protein RodZ
MTSQKELIPMKPGELLRLAREQKRLTLEAAAAQSRIKLTVLEAIESGETSSIPSVYLRGYLRNYARFLGVQLEKIEQNLDDVKGAEPEMRSVFTYNTNRNHSDRWLKVSSYIAASLLIATLTWQFTHEAVLWSQGDSRLQSTAQENPSAPPADTAAAGRPAQTHMSASIAAVEVMKQRGELNSGAVAEEAWGAMHSSTETELPEGQHRLTVTTSADTWVEIFGAADEQLEMDLIRAGTTREYTGQGPFRIMIGRAAAVVMTMDGEKVDLGPYTRGNVARMTLGAELSADSSQTDEAADNH